MTNPDSIRYFKDSKGKFQKIELTPDEITEIDEQTRMRNKRITTESIFDAMDILNDTRNEYFSKSDVIRLAILLADKRTTHTFFNCQRRLDELVDEARDGARKK